MARSQSAKQLVDLFFLGQYMLVSLLPPSFAAGAITGEKERHSYEMLLASPLRPGAIVLGKLFASLCHLAILMFCSLPIVMLCLPLGGVSPYEVMAAYFAMILSVGLFGMISLWTSSIFRRTSESLVVSYLLILPLAIVSVLAWNELGRNAEIRLLLVVTVVPIAYLSLGALMWHDACRRLLYPSDLGSEGKEVVDLETEAREAVGLYIKGDEFPDPLFAPPSGDHIPRRRREPDLRQGDAERDLRPGYADAATGDPDQHGAGTGRDGVLPVRGPRYSHPGTSLTCCCSTYWWARSSRPAASPAGRQRQKLDLLLTTLVTPWQMLWGKLLSGLRVSSVLTGFLLWPLVLACLMPPLGFWSHLPTIFGYIYVVALCCVTTAMMPCFSLDGVSQIGHEPDLRRTDHHRFVRRPLGSQVFRPGTFFQGHDIAAVVEKVGVLSPFAATFSLPLAMENGDTGGIVCERGEFQFAVVLWLRRLVVGIQRTALAGDDQVVPGAGARGGLVAVSLRALRLTVTP